MLIFIAAVLVFWSGFAMGFAWRNIRVRLNELARQIAAVDQPEEPVVTESRGTVIDPEDPVQRAKWERDQMMQALNPEIDE